MPSSTSSFSKSAPLSSSWKMWLGGVLLAFLCLFAMETFWWYLGHGTTITDDMVHWSEHRNQAYGKNKVVFLGSSRIQLAIDLEVVSHEFPHHSFLQLAVDGKGPMAALIDLMDDEGFTGKIVVSSRPLKMSKNFWKDQEPYVNYYNNSFRLNDRLNRYAKTFLQNNLVIKNHTINLKRVLTSILSRREIPSPFYLKIHPNRAIDGDYSKLDIVSHRQERMVLETALYERTTSHPSPAKWLRDINVLNTKILALRKREGDVLFLRMPTCRELLSLDRTYYPKSEYWDRFAQSTTSKTLNFSDYTQLSTFECPDFSHIDVKDKVRFTKELSVIFRNLSFL